MIIIILKVTKEREIEKKKTFQSTYTYDRKKKEEEKKVEFDEVYKNRPYPSSSFIPTKKEEQEISHFRKKFNSKKMGKLSKGICLKNGLHEANDSFHGF